MKKRTPASLALTAVTALIAILYLYPLFLVIINSFKTFSEITSNVISLPSSLNLSNFVKAFAIMQYPRYFLNTFIATSIGVVGVVTLSSLAGFKLSRTKTRYSWVVFMVMIAPMMIPFHSFMIALVKIAKSLSLTGSPIGLGVLYWGLGTPLALFLYHGFVKSVPQELDDCALIDGASPIRAFAQVIFPLLQPVTVSVIVINAMWMWNDFLLPLLVLSGSKKALTLQLATYNFFGMYKIDWNFAMAGVLLTLAPAILLYLSLQKHIIKGMTAGAVKT
ncbi:carbohydrate ABC transporter permease [Sphaerochaeta sp. PS]|uniref:carbohydrate ABC transporter permease n=1 Tax=Sphaerochaeta sp. PS TaxID=3076336 RepID=UPI0028A31247|nr:carbohydrate ABC transporter permease [Sphaerochaeta sp. PS]MDT4761772.1 carbohydrate ABC transporter permease [Sphaerochaeta sp. PS]